MKNTDEAIESAAAWMSDMAQRVKWGEVGMKLVLHCGKVVRVERLTIDKCQDTVATAVSMQSIDTKTESEQIMRQRGTPHG